MSDSAFVASAFVAACRDELEAPKPGNVHIFAPGHRMEAQDFVASAEVAAAPLAARDASVGARILGAMQATLARVRQNTNLGIVLLCAPLAHATLNFPQEPLDSAVRRVLAGLTRGDATDAFMAITLANPAGLGKAPAHDVGGPAEATLLEAMRAAADRDLIAQQYANGFADIFGLGRRTLAAARDAKAGREEATLRVYLAFLASFPDSHILRKHGAAIAQMAMLEAQDFSRSLASRRGIEEIRSAALSFDARLKAAGINPGTSADLTVATLFADRLERRG